MKFKFVSAVLALFVFSTTAVATTIYPVPQSVNEKAAGRAISPRVNLVVESGLDQSVTDYATEVLVGAGYRVLTSNYSASSTYLYIGVNGSGGEADRAATEAGLSRTVFQSAANHFDPYLLYAGDNASDPIIILGDANGSAFYGVATLRQLLTTSRSIKPITIQDYSYTQYRGVVEGFYGTPFTVDQILEMFDFFKHFKMNTFIYGPKADPYHAGYWSNDYPTSLTDEQKTNGWLTQEDIRVIAAKAKACNINFVWAIHPGMHDGLDFSSKTAMNPGIERIMTKFQKMYDLGVRGFGVFIDDMSSVPSAEMTAYLPAQVQAKLKAKWNTASTPKENQVSPLFFVPTAYSIAHTTSSLTQLKNIDSSVVIAFTGADVWSNINAGNCSTMKTVLGRNPLFWWNNPCNDNHDDRLYMLDMNYRYSAQNAPITALGGVVYNTMQEASASKVFLFGGADYAWNTASFNSTTNWENCFAGIFPNNPDIATAFKKFCVNQETTNEPQDLRDLYSAFQSGYSRTSLPSVTTSALISRMTDIVNACTLLRDMQTGDKSQQLMWEDIKPWCEKLRSMANIIKCSLQWMQNPGGLEHWTDYALIVKEYAMLHKNPDFYAACVEGSGIEAARREFEVHPAQQYMEPFVDFVMSKLSDFAPQLPERSRNPKMIHNFTTVPSSLYFYGSSENSYITGLTNVSLKPAEFVGIYLNNISGAIVTMSGTMGSGLTCQYSLNGKDWTDFTPTTSPQVMAYFRIINSSTSAKTVGFNMLTLSAPTSGLVTPVVPSTNIPQYEDYSVNNVVNYDSDTHFWSSREQQAGDYVMIDMGGTKSVSAVELGFNSNDQPTGSFAVELSANNATWETIGTYTASNIVNNMLRVSVDNKMARYARIRLTSASGTNWFILRYIKAFTGQKHSVATDHEDEYTDALDDRDLTSCYVASGAGHIEYTFIEDLKIESVQIYHCSAFDTNSELPQVYIEDFNGEKLLGELNSPITEFNVAGLHRLSKLRIVWNEVNIPSIHDVVVTGPQYVYPKDFSSVDDLLEGQPMSINMLGDELRISGYRGEIEVYTPMGVLLYNGRVEGSATLPIRVVDPVVIVKYGSKVIKVHR